MRIAQRKLIVHIAPDEYLFHEGEQVYVARLTPLGITSYGDSLEEAVEKTHIMFESKAKAHARHGSLEAWLQESGVEWSYVGEDSDFTEENAQAPSEHTWRPALPELMAAVV